jgi:hypothetical protein
LVVVLYSPKLGLAAVVAFSSPLLVAWSTMP